MTRENLERAFLETRAQTETLCSTLEFEDFVVQTAEFMSPPRWHLGHTSWLFEMLLQELDPRVTPYRADYLYFFNSYYEKHGARI